MNRGARGNSISSRWIMDWLQLRSIERVLAAVVGGVYIAY
jgi:hypothetical protein